MLRIAALTVTASDEGGEVQVAIAKGAATQITHLWVKLHSETIRATIPWSQPRNSTDPDPFQNTKAG